VPHLSLQKPTAPRQPSYQPASTEITLERRTVPRESGEQSAPRNSWEQRVPVELGRGPGPVKYRLLHFDRGGTITSHAGNPERPDAYQAGAASGMEFTRGVKIPKHTQIDLVTLGAKDSKDHESGDLRRARDYAQVHGDKYHAFVDSSGSDAMERSGCHDLWTGFDKPLIKTAAMLPNSVAGKPKWVGDGKQNLEDAYALAKKAAKTPEMRNSVLVTMARKIFAPPFFAKRHTHAVDAFQAVNGEPVGTITKDPLRRMLGRGPKVQIDKVPEASPFKFDAGKGELPPVDLLYTEMGEPRRTVMKIDDAFGKNGAEGVVIAGTGNGTLHKDVEATLTKWAKQDKPIVVASQTGFGEVTRNGTFPHDQHGIFAAGKLTPQAATLGLQLVLADTKVKAEASGRPFDMRAAKDSADKFFTYYQSPEYRPRNQEASGSGEK
jgi:L-asparaginase